MTATEKQKQGSRLGKVKSGTLNEPLRYLFYGSEGVGKTTLASGSDNPIMIDVEGGSAMVDVPRYSFRDEGRSTIPLSIEEVVFAINDLRKSKHEYKTLIVDSLGALEALIWDKICKDNKVSTIGDVEYGHGYRIALDYFRNICFILDKLRTEKGLTIILTGHSLTKVFKNPLADDYDRINLRMHPLSADFLRGWSDVVGYCAFEDGSSKANKRSRVKGFSTGRRLMHLSRTACYDAKSRVPLPSYIELEAGDSWAPFAAAVSAGRNTSAKELKAQIEAELVRIDSDDSREKASKFVKSANNNTSRLSVILNKLKEQPSVSEEIADEETPTTSEEK